MFKNLMLFHFGFTKDAPSFGQIEEALQKNKFTPCQSLQACSVGWVPPRGYENGALIESVNGQWILRLQIEEKTVPPDIIKQKLKEVCDKMEKDSGRRPGRRYQKEIKDQIYQELLPRAFPRQKGMWVWINLQNRFLMVEAVSNKLAGTVVTALVKAIEGMAISDIQTKMSPAVGMTDWLMTDPPEDFSVDMDCRLKAENELKTVLSYSRHHLDTASEVKEYIEGGMNPEQLALTWKNRVGFVLTDDLKIKRIKFRDVVFEGNANDSDDVFDADVAIATGELQPMLGDLFGALDGIQQPEKMPIFEDEEAAEV